MSDPSGIAGTSLNLLDPDGFPVATPFSTTGNPLDQPFGGFQPIKPLTEMGAGGAIGLGLGLLIMQMQKANEQAGTPAKTQASTTTCQSCGDREPCASLACGNPASEYRGGAYYCMTKPKGDQKDAHHMPAASVSKLPKEMGPAIQMDRRDHRLTNSYGARANTNKILSEQNQLINSGDFMAAQAKDIAEIESKFSKKYDAAIAQMEAYTACLKKNGQV